MLGTDEATRTEILGRLMSEGCDTVLGHLSEGATREEPV